MYFIHYTDCPSTVLSRLDFRQPSSHLIRFDSMHYGAQPVFLPSEDVAIAVIGVIRALYPTSQALSFTKVRDLSA